MSKSGKKATLKKALKARQIKQQQQNQQHKAGKYLRFLKNTKTQVSFLIGVVGFLFVVWPRISVYTGESLDPHDPFATPFIIKNDGYLPIRDIHYSITPKNIKFLTPGRGQATIMGETDNVFIIVPLVKKLPLLGTNKTTAIFLPLPTEKPIDVKSADIYINLVYKPYLVPYTFSERHSFVTTVKKTGEYVWLEDYSK